MIRWSFEIDATDVLSSLVEEEEEAEVVEGEEGKWATSRLAPLCVMRNFAAMLR